MFGFERLLSEGGGGTAAGLIPNWLRSSASLTIHPAAAIWHGQPLQHLLKSILAYSGLLRTGHDLPSWLMTSLIVWPLTAKLLVKRWSQPVVHQLHSISLRSTMIGIQMNVLDRQALLTSGRWSTRADPSHPGGRGRPSRAGAAAPYRPFGRGPPRSPGAALILVSRMRSGASYFALAQSLPWWVVSRFITAPIASADSTDDGYLQALKDRGITQPSGSDQTMVQIGHAVCTDWSRGMTFDRTFADAKSGLPQLQDVSIARITGAAPRACCPQYTSKFD